MFNYNHVTIVGRVTNDPKFEKVDGNTICSFMLKVDRPYSKEDGTIECDFIPVIMLGKLADVAERYLAKARPTLVEGRIQLRELKTGKSYQYVTEIIAENFQILEHLKNEKCNDYS